MGEDGKKTAICAYLAAVGVSPERTEYCLPILTGDAQLPTRETNAKTITMVEAAKIGGVSRGTIWRMTKDGTIPTVSIRGKNRVRLADVLAAFSVVMSPSEKTAQK